MGTSKPIKEIAEYKMKLKEYEVMLIISPPSAEPADCPIPNARKAKLTPTEGVAVKIRVPQTIKIPVINIYDMPNKIAER